MINWLNLIIEELRFYELYKCNILDFIGLVSPFLLFCQRMVVNCKVNHIQSNMGGGGVKSL